MDNLSVIPLANTSTDEARRALVMRLASHNSKMIWLADAGGARFFFSPRWQSYTAADPAKLDETWLNYVHEADRQRVKILLSSAFATKQAFHIEYRLRRKDGVYRQILDSGTPEFADDGSLLGYLGTSTDINETIHSSSKLFSQQTQIAKNQIDTNFNSPIAIWKLNDEFRIEKVNPVVYELLADRSDIIGMKLSEVVPSISESLLTAVFVGKRKVSTICKNVILAKPRPGKPRDWNVSIWPITDRNGRAVGVCLSTVETPAESEAIDSVEHIVATLVHDLKSPLIGAERTFEALLNGHLGKLDSDLEKILQILNRGNRSMLEMIQNLIQLQRSQLTDVPFILERENILDIARETLQELSALAQNRGITIVDQLPKNAEILPVERTYMKRVFYNLVSNALKFTRGGGTIMLSARMTESAVSIAISDTGIGIPQEDQTHLFERYFQGQKGRRQTDGSGLGLYLCKNVIEKHGGRIGVTSEEGKGSTFTIVLPRQQAQQSNARPRISAVSSIN
jgi:PAS domain S-box-containing protein